MVAEQAAIIAQRLDVALAELERLELELVSERNLHVARDVSHITLDLRLLRRQIDNLLQYINPPTSPRSLVLVGPDRLTAPRAGGPA